MARDNAEKKALFLAACEEHGIEETTSAGAEVRALAPAQHAASPLDLPVEVFRAGLDRRRANRSALLDWIRAALVEGVDYGVIPTKRGPSKPSLWKPGAEKICGMLGVVAAFPTLHDYEQAALHGVKLEHVVIRCELRDASGRVVADGVGARSLRQDGGDLNKALKMAEKSAHIDATLRMAGLSEVFTQDIEDMVADGRIEAAEPAPQPARSVQPPAPADDLGQRPATKSDLKHLMKAIAAAGLDPARVDAWMEKAWGVKNWLQLTSAQVDRLLVKIDQWAPIYGRDDGSPDPY